MYQQHQFSCPIISGWGSISVLGEKIRELDRSRPLVVCDRGIVEAGIIEKVGAVLRDAGLEFSVYDGVKPDPSAEIVDEAVEAGLAFRCDVVIGVGAFCASSLVVIWFARNGIPCSFAVCSRIGTYLPLNGHWLV